MMFMNSILKYDAIKPLFLTLNGIKMQLNLSPRKTRTSKKPWQFFFFFLKRSALKKPWQFFTYALYLLSMVHLEL